MALAPGAATARDATAGGAEIGVGLLDHGVLVLDNPDLPPGAWYESTEERGTVDVQLVYRTRPLRFALKPRLTARMQVNTGGRTSFASLGAEWRQHVLQGRVYGQIGIGLTLHDGYVRAPDPFAVAPGSPEFQRRYEIYRTRTEFGSRVLFNPNLSLGVRLDRRWAMEAAWEHFSHNQWFGRQNPGIDTVGVRLVRTLGRDRGR